MQPVAQNPDLRAGGERASYTNRSAGPRCLCGDLRPFAQILSSAFRGSGHRQFQSDRFDAHTKLHWITSSRRGLQPMPLTAEFSRIRLPDLTQRIAHHDVLPTQARNRKVVTLGEVAAAEI